MLTEHACMAHLCCRLTSPWVRDRALTSDQHTERPNPAGQPFQQAAQAFSVLTDDELAQVREANRVAILRDLEDGEGRNIRRLFAEQMNLLRERIRRLKAGMR